jgi:hypothetical protein
VVTDTPHVSFATLAEDLQNRIVNKLYGTTHVLALKCSVGTPGSEEDALVVELTLSDPSGDTWPLSDLRLMYKEVIDLVAASGFDAVTTYMRVSPKTPEVEEGDDNQLPFD